ncbi:MAG: 16S rRNA (guanine(966)-N(2))-methyltransferase RsmD [Gammaproteobacteria bacterium]
MSPKSTQGQLRIIGGSWRGRKLAFAPIPGLRPTPDRVRETLFNWLAPVIRGARCLDLFAGSGALGIEAASRGAAECVLVEHDAQAVRVLREQVGRLDATQVRVVEADALHWLCLDPQPFDIVFLDPPFSAGLLPECMRLLEARGWLAPETWIYLEAGAAEAPELPDNWELYRDRRAGQVSYRLVRRSAMPAL